VTSAQGRSEAARSELARIAESLREKYAAGRRVLSFPDYVELFAEDPVRYGRDAATYVRDMFDHYGTTRAARPWGAVRRFTLFDLPWDDATEAGDARLVGHEELQGELYRAIENLVKEGRANRLVLMHGPNGSAKSTIAACVLRALENYSTLAEGALYRFHWVFPSRKTLRGSIGFGEATEEQKKGSQPASFAHLPDDQIDARLSMELRDHPLLLLPIAERRVLLERLFSATGKKPPTWLLKGQLSHKNQQVYEALMNAENGDLSAVFRHVLVERFFVSRRYRVGAITLGPELSVDAGERQVTADRSLAALPTALSSTTLFEAHGELVDAASGVIEFSDLLKRPIDAFRYLQLALETGEIQLPRQTIPLNTVMIGSANEVHLAAFREHHEFPSFRGRFELVKAPYLRSAVDEQRIYDLQIASRQSRHVAPHATEVAAEFAVMTRLDKPDPKAYPDELGRIVEHMTVEQKLDLYATGKLPEKLEADQRKVLRAGLERLFRETESNVEYEGMTGASPRTMRTVLLDAAQSADHEGLSPFAVLGELDELCKQTSEYDWLRQKAQPGGFSDHKEIRTVVRRRLLDRLEEEMRRASGLVDEGRYVELFEKYVSHVSVWTKGEKIRNAMTGEYQDPDERLMREIEGLLGVKEKNEEHRRGLISSIAAWAIEHPGQKVDPKVVFPALIQKIKDAVFLERRKPVALLVKDLVGILRARKEAKDKSARGEPVDERPIDHGLGEQRRKAALEALERLVAMGYDDASALDAASAVLQARYAELVA
jgi:serine protein kinase